MSIIDEKLKVANGKKEDIIKFLENNKFPKMNDKYDYLINMPYIIHI